MHVEYGSGTIQGHAALDVLFLNEGQVRIVNQTFGLATDMPLSLFSDDISKGIIIN